MDMMNEQWVRELDLALRKRIDDDMEGSKGSKGSDDDDNDPEGYSDGLIPGLDGLRDVAFRCARRTLFKERNLEQKRAIFSHYMQGIGREVMPVPFDAALPKQHVDEIKDCIVAGVQLRIAEAQTEEDLRAIMNATLFVATTSATSATAITYGSQATQLRNLTSFEIERVLAAARGMWNSNMPIDAICETLLQMIV